MPERQIGVYWESWLTKSLSTLLEPFNVVYLAFASPECYYTKGSHSFNGTGLNFTESFMDVTVAIQNLQNKGIKVLLAVGGASYWSEPKDFNTQGILDLVNDLGVDGIDIDWEVGTHDTWSSTSAVREIKRLSPQSYISYTGFSTGTYQPNEWDPYRGMNIPTLNECAGLINHVNIMAYDAGEDFDEQESFRSYREYYRGIINLGFQVGNQGWGDAMLYEPEARNNLEFVKDQDPRDGCFTWAHHKSADDGITVDEFGQLAKEMFKEDTTVTYKCPTCYNGMQIKICALPK